MPKPVYRPPTPPLKWHGGKHYLASKILTLMPPHLHYVEPYFGGGAVLLHKDPEGVSEVVNDLHGDLTNFWWTLQHADLFRDFVRVARVTPFSEYEFRLAKAATVFGSDADRATAFFITCRMSRAGMMKDFTTLTRNRVRRGMNAEASAWLTCVEGLPEVHERLKRVVILNRDALDVIRQQDGLDTLFYLDPPYLHETRASTDSYTHEMTRRQHEELLSLLTVIDGKFVLSGYPSDLYVATAAERGWVRHDFDLPNHAAGGKVKRRMTECVWMNYDPPGA